MGRDAISRVAISRSLRKIRAYLLIRGTLPNTRLAQLSLAYADR
jgi:hypothetical protein